MNIDFSKTGDTSRTWQFHWHILFASVFGAGLLCSLLSLLIRNQLGIFFSLIGTILLGIAVLAAGLGILILTRENVHSIKKNGDRIDSLIEITNRNRNLLNQVARAVRLSDAAKEIAFRDQDRMELQEAILTKLHQHDFAATEEMIEAVSKRTEYREMADQLRRDAEEYRNATEENRIRQAAGHVERLIQERKWAAAAAQIDTMTQTFPDSDYVRNLQQNLREAKDSRKRELLAAWDEAVKREEVDLGLEILRELDMYLTPNEGLALQESASHVYRAKLHNLGVQFSLAVTENRWETAAETGKIIVRDFPNSRMAHEIRSKMHILEQKAQSNR